MLSNVKNRGVMGEVQLAALLEQILTPEQYETNVATRPGSRDRVEFAIKLPGRDSEGTVWLPLDAKFPTEDYQRLQQRQDAADPVASGRAAKVLEARMRLAQFYFAHGFAAETLGVLRVANPALLARVTERR